MGGTFSSFADYYQKDEPSSPLPNRRFLVEDSRFDPRSPSEGIQRTPIQLPGPVQQIIDPRSPSEGVHRTPIIKHVLAEDILMMRTQVQFDSEVAGVEGCEGEDNYGEEDEDCEEEVYDEEEEEEDEWVGEPESTSVASGDAEPSNEEVSDIVNNTEKNEESVSAKEKSTLEGNIERMSRKLRELQQSVDSDSVGDDLYTWGVERKSDSCRNAPVKRQVSVRSKSASPCRHHRQLKRSARGSSVDEETSDQMNNGFIATTGGDTWYYEPELSHFRLTSEEIDMKASDCYHSYTDEEKALKDLHRAIKYDLTSTPIQPVAPKRVVLKKLNPNPVLLEEVTPKKGTQLRPVKEQKENRGLHKPSKVIEAIAGKKVHMGIIMSSPKVASRKPLTQNTPVLVQPRVLIRNKQIRKLKKNLDQADKEN